MNANQFVSFARHQNRVLTCAKQTRNDAAARNAQRIRDLSMKRARAYRAAEKAGRFA